MQVVNGAGTNQLEGANILIATGTKPAVNAKVPINGRNIIDSDQILSMAQLPKTGQVTERLLVVFLASRTNLGQKLYNRILGNASHMDSSSN